MVTRHNNPALLPEERALYGPEAGAAAASAPHEHGDCGCADAYRQMLAYLDKRDTPNPHALFEFPADGTSYTQLLNVGYKIRCMSFINLTTVSFTIVFDEGSSLPVQAGAVMAFIPPETQSVTITSASATSGTLRLYVYANEPNVVVGGAIFSVGGGSGGNVSIVGPLDGAGGVKVGIDAPLPAGANNIGHIDVDNFPATQPVSGSVGITGALPAGANVIGSVGVNGALPAGANLIGQIVAQGNIGDLQQDSVGNVYVIDRATPNWATAQVATSTTAGTAAGARPTRVRCEIRNLDATNNVFIGPTTVTSANGVILKPGESRAFYTQTLLQAISSAGTPTIEVNDYWT
jgi:hypothetical protein